MSKWPLWHRMSVPRDPAAPPLTDEERTQREKRLKLIWWVAVADLILLIPLIIGVITDNHGLAPILGPIHGAGFLFEVYLTGLGAQDRWWGWWYPAVTLITTGPPGALLGHRKAHNEALT